MEPVIDSGNHVRSAIAPARYTIAAMRRWSELAERLAATTRTSEKTALLADYLRTLTPDELPIAAVFLTGRPFPEADQRAAGLGWAAIATTVAELAGVDRAALGEAYDRHSDLGLAVADVLTLAGHAPPADRLRRSPRWPPRSRRSRRPPGPARKSAILGTLLARADPLTAKYIVKVLGGELRIGLREGLLEAAIAKAFDRPLDDVKWAGMLTGDIGRLATLARDDRLGHGRDDPVPPAQVHARLAGRGRRRDHPAARAGGLGRGQVRRDPRPAPQAGRRTSGSSRATCTT